MMMMMMMMHIEVKSVLVIYKSAYKTHRHVT